MTWLNHVLATPTVGCGYKPSFQTSQDYIGALRPLLKKWGETADLNVLTDQTLNLTIQRKPGYTYAFVPDKSSVQFSYSYQLKQKPGEAIPELTPGLEVEKFSSLLEEAIEEYCDVFDQIVGSESRAVGRLGISANCRLDGESLPPGVRLFIKHLAHPWGETLQKCQVHLLATIAEEEKIRDRCHHQLNMDDDRKNDVRLTLDWQRLFLSEIQVGKGKLLREQFKRCTGEALEYFERFGKGDLKYGAID